MNKSQNDVINKTVYLVRDTKPEVLKLLSLQNPFREPHQHMHRVWGNPSTYPEWCNAKQKAAIYGVLIKPMKGSQGAPGLQEENCCSNHLLMQELSCLLTCLIKKVSEHTALKLMFVSVPSLLTEARSYSGQSNW